MFGRNLLQTSDFSGPELERVLRVAKRLKDTHKRGLPFEVLRGKCLAMLFEKPSNRTRVSFSVAMLQLGGQALDIRPDEIQLGVRETVPDAARTLSRFVDGVMLRVKSHALIEEFARHASVPVINGLSDCAHPCQAIADILTIDEKLARKDANVCYIGDGNNVCISLEQACSVLKIPMTICTPPGYEPKTDFATLEVDPYAAVKNASIIYTDVWVSMGQETEMEKRKRDFRNYQVTEELCKQARPNALFMHCLPAHRDDEVSGEVLDGPRSVVFDQAENRLHAQKAVLALLLSQHPNELLS